MRKFIGKMLLAFVPFMLYLLLFLLFEPHNYFGIKPERTGAWSQPLATAREFMRNPSTNIILGDSRWYRLDLDQIEDLTGDRYAMLATGGQGINLSRELYDWVQKIQATDKLVIGASFFQMHSTNNSPSAGPVLYIAEHPLDYLVTRDYCIDAFVSLQQYVNNCKQGDFSLLSVWKPQENVKPATPEILEEYVNTIILPTVKQYQVGQTQIDDICYMVEDVQRRGGNSLVVYPPVHTSIWDLAIEPMDIEPQFEVYKVPIANKTLCYDFEWRNSFSEQNHWYADGFHFRLDNALEQFTYAVFTGESDSLKILGPTNAP